MAANEDRGVHLDVEQHAFRRLPDGEKGRRDVIPRG
jgi:hypothetical protein